MARGVKSGGTRARVRAKPRDEARADGLMMDFASRMKRAVDESGRLGTVALFDPPRSAISAAFDPANAGKNDLLGAVAGAAPYVAGAGVVGAALAPGEAEAGLLDTAGRAVRRAASDAMGVRSREGERSLTRGERRVGGRMSPQDTTDVNEGVSGIIDPQDVRGIQSERRRLLAEARAFAKRHPNADWSRSGFNVKRDKKTGELVVTPKKEGYGFHINPRTGKEAKRGDGHYNRMVTGIADEIIDVARRANTGDPKAGRVWENQGWYKNVETRLATEYGSFADEFSDLLGATSPNTPVATNFDFSQDILKRAWRGDFDPQMDGFADLLDKRARIKDQMDRHVEVARANGLSVKAAEQSPTYQALDAESKAIGKQFKDKANLILQSDGQKQYGINSYNSMVALADRWRKVRVGSAPKAKNFSGNLAGFNPQATIDVWSARNLRRHAGKKPIPSAAETGVAGNVVEVFDDGTFRSNSEFGMGQSVLADVTERVNRELGESLEPRDIQALQWFIEKDHWADRGWTSAQGEGGSFETMMDEAPTGSMAAGISREQSEGLQGGKYVPDDAAQASAGRRFMEAAQADPDVLAAKADDTQGRYFGETERSLDVDIVVNEDMLPTETLDRIARQAVADNQDSFFIARRVRPEVGRSRQDAFNVGSEAYFQNPLDMDAPMLAQMERWLGKRDVPGFTVITDPRTGKANGIRFLDIPQFYDAERFAKMSPQDYGEHVRKTFDEYGQLGEDLKGAFPAIRAARPAYFDINVKSGRSAEDYLAQQQDRSRDPDALHQEFWGFKPATTRFREYVGATQPYYQPRGAPASGAGRPRGLKGAIAASIPVGAAVASQAQADVAQWGREITARRDARIQREDLARQRQQARADRLRAIDTAISDALRRPTYHTPEGEQIPPEMAQMRRARGEPVIEQSSALGDVLDFVRPSPAAAAAWIEPMTGQNSAAAERAMSVLDVPGVLMGFAVDQILEGME